MKELEFNTVESSEFIEQTFHFWFTDNQHIRSPFPLYIRSVLKEKSIEMFYKWAKGLNPKAKDEINDEIIAEKFEEIIFENALSLIKTEDERITILYPFLPRLGDKLDKKNDVIIDRAIIKDGDTKYLKIVLENPISKKKWDTSFELPE